MNKDLWEELVAQVETHGPQAIRFELETGDRSEQVMVSGIKFEDGVILVSMY